MSINNNEKKIKSLVSAGQVADVPLVLQLESLECGAACLAMILAYFEKWIPLEVVRSDCGVSRDGSSAYNVTRAAKAYGLETKAYRYGADMLEVMGTFPCICFWEGRHFVVVKGFRKGIVYINDPGDGQLELTVQQFKESYSGLVMIYSPGPDFKPEGKPRDMLEYAGRIVRDLRKPIIIAGIFALISALLGLINPLITKQFYDVVLPSGGNQTLLIKFIGAIALIYIVQIIISCISTMSSYKIGGEVAFGTSSTFISKLLRLPIDFYSQRQRGDILSRQDSASSVANTLISVVAPILIDALSMLFYLFLMVLYSPVLALVGVLSVVINAFLSKMVTKKRVDLIRQLTKYSSKLTGSTVITMQMMETIKASGAEEKSYHDWDKNCFSELLVKTEMESKNLWFSIIPQFVSSSLGAIMIALGIGFVIKGVTSGSGEVFTLGLVTAFQGLYTSFAGPVNAFIDSKQTILEMRTDAERLEDVMRYPDDENCMPRDGVITCSKLKGELEIKKLTFGYARLGEPFLIDFNMTIKPGQTIAIVGASGSGKSTVAKLIAGLYEPWSGEILFDGRKRFEYSRKTMTDSISIVDQTIALFPDTIRNNITIWDDSIPQENVIKAAADAQLLDCVMQRKEGFSYVLKENGRDFSGGQRQEIEIARALVNNPSILILDEATSALDAATEAKVIASVTARGMSCILVAHRLSTIRNADEIIVLDKGTVVERGTHSELLKNGGYYAALVSNN